MEFRLRFPEIMERLCAPVGDPRPSPPVAVIAAHPDDEVIGAGGRLPRLKRCVLIQITDGAPVDMIDARKAGFQSREEYARTRRRELMAALSLADIKADQCLEIGLIDQEASFHLVELTHQLVRILADGKPEVVLTHPYEGGHPDHDAVALAVQAACKILPGKGSRPPVLIEFTSYHARLPSSSGPVERSAHEKSRGGEYPTLPGDGEIIRGEFLPYHHQEVTEVFLSEEERALKARMMNCFVTQKGILVHFPIGVERFRPAPDYDFTRPPHPGLLYYGHFSWGMTGHCFRSLAAQALHELGFRGSPCL